jgi:hypothetical protein
MLRPFLFVGIGGSGGKTLRALKQTLDRRLKQKDWERGLPGAWQFVQVDTAYDGVTFPAPMMPLEDFIGMVGPGQDYDHMVRSLENRIGAPEDRRKALGGWLAPRTTVPIHAGAGQVRTLGRGVSAAGLMNLKAGLKDALDKMQAPSNMSELSDLSKILHPKSGSGGVVKDPIVIVISSIAGGSGAGMFMDVTETLKSIDPNAIWLKQQTAYLYTPEVFDSIKAQYRAQIPMNALGAMNEIMAGLWADEVSEGTEILFNASGVQVLRNPGKGAVGPAGVFLVGSKNASGVNIAQGNEGEGMDEVFLAVGEAISGLVTDEDLADNYEAYFFANVFSNSGKDTTLADHTGLCRPTDVLERMPFGALGFARVTLGMDRLMDYASEGLTKAHVHTLLFPKFETVDQLNPISDADHIERRVVAGRDDFIRGSRLNERQPNDQIVNYLRGDDLNVASWDAAPGVQQDAGAVRKRQAQDFAKSCVPTAAQNPNAKNSAANWRTMLLQNAATIMPKFLAEQRSEVEKRARTWTEEIQKHLVDFAAKNVSDFGLKVTAGLFSILRDDLKQISTQEMPQEAEMMRSRGAVYESDVAGCLGAGTELSVASTEVGNALRALQIGAERKAETALLEYVPILIKDIISGVIEPIIEECELAFKLLDGDLDPSPAGGAGRLFREFAQLKDDRSNGYVSARYKPRQVERMLISSDTFPQEFEQIEKMDLLDDDKDNWSSIVNAWSLKGIPLGAKDPRFQGKANQTLFTVKESWVPNESHARKDSSLGPRKLDIGLPHSLGDLVERNRTWLENRDSRFGRQYRMSLSDFATGGNKSQQADRQQKFLSAFTDLVQLSSPLITINQAAVTEFHHHSDPNMTPHGYTLHLTPIPFAEQSAVGKECEQIIQRFNKTDPPTLRFDPASTTTDLFGFSTVKVAMSPMVYTSLIQPIADAWLTSSSNGNSVHSFWDGRRARPLTESIPVSPQIRLSMIAGLLVGKVFGLTRKADSTSNGMEVRQVWGPNQGWMAFPSPLLPVTASDINSLPAILKSISIAIVEAGRTASTAPLMPYMRLKDIGREVTTPVRLDLLDRDGNGASNLIDNWVRTGFLPPEAPEMPPFTFDIDSWDLSTPTGRRDALSKEIDLVRNEYKELWQKLEAADWRDIPRIYELKGDIDQAINAIHDYVVGISLESSTSRISD